MKSVPKYLTQRINQRAKIIIPNLSMELQAVCAVKKIGINYRFEKLIKN